MLLHTRIQSSTRSSSPSSIFITLLDDTSRCLKVLSPTVSGNVLKHHFSSLIGIPASVQCLVTGSLNINDDTLLSAFVGFFASCTLLLYLCADKGGFRGTGQKKTNNFDACHDLSGRCLRHINAEKTLEEWKAAAKDQKLDEQLKKAKEVKKNSSVVIGIDNDSVEDGGDDVVLDVGSKKVEGVRVC